MGRGARPHRRGHAADRGAAWTRRRSPSASRPPRPRRSADSAALRAAAEECVRHAEPLSAASTCAAGGAALRPSYTFGVGSVAIGGGAGAMADIANSGCLILWGYNPSFSRLTHATATVADALQRGMKLIVIDPRRVGLAAKADVWLRVRPGSDGALALGLANLMIQNGWYDRTFIQTWSNGPLLVRNDTGRLLSARRHGPRGRAPLLRLASNRGAPVGYDAAPAATRRTLEPGAGRRIPVATPRRRGGLSSRVRALRRALPQPSAAKPSRRHAGFRPTSSKRPPG